MFRYLSDEQLTAIKKYEYKVVDYSFLYPYIITMWNTILDKLPLTIAPNLLTITGLLINIFILYITENFYTSYLVPLILLCYYICAMLDTLDGMQARRIKNSTAVGELLDHSADIVTLFVVCRITLIIVGLRDQPMLPLYMLAGTIFCRAHYQSYIDGFLTLDRFTGPAEILTMVVIGYLTNFFFDWSQIIGSPIFYYICLSVCMMVPIYLITIAKTTNQYYVLDINMTYNSAIVLLGYLLEVSCLQMCCIYILINGELITRKITKSKFQIGIQLYYLACMTHPVAALTIVFLYYHTIITQMLAYLNIPMFSTF